MTEAASATASGGSHLRPVPDVSTEKLTIAQAVRDALGDEMVAAVPASAIDGKIGGHPDRMEQEWAAQGETKGAWLRLTWPKARTIDRVWLFDRPTHLDRIMAAELRFSDGAPIAVGPLPDSAAQGREIAFPPRTVTWLEVRVTKTKSDHPYVGISEIAVFAAKAERN